MSQRNRISNNSDSRLQRNIGDRYVPYDVDIIRNTAAPSIPPRMFPNTIPPRSNNHSSQVAPVVDPVNAVVEQNGVRNNNPFLQNVPANADLIDLLGPNEQQQQQQQQPQQQPAQQQQQQQIPQRGAFGIVGNHGHDLDNIPQPPAGYNNWEQVQAIYHYGKLFTDYLFYKQEYNDVKYDRDGLQRKYGYIQRKMRDMEVTIADLEVKNKELLMKCEITNEIIDRVMKQQK